jgi:hypothetical protein
MRPFRFLIPLAVAHALLGMAITRAEDQPNDPGQGLKAEYFKDAALKELALTRVDPQIAFNWYEGQADSALPADHFSIRWSGWLRSPGKGKVKFILLVDDVIRLELGGRKVIDTFATVGNSVITHEFESTGKPIEFKLEYREFTGPSRCLLYWVTPGSNHMTLVPPEAFARDERTARKAVPAQHAKRPPEHGALYEFFESGSFEKRTLAAFLDSIETDWDWGQPLPGVGPDRFAVRITADLHPAVSGEYRLVLHHDDGARLFVDDVLLIDHWNSKPYWGEAVLKFDGKPKSIRIEHHEVTGRACIQLHWIPPGAKTHSPVPSSALKPGVLKPIKPSRPAKAKKG